MKGILFKPDMIQAIVEGRKTQTRRVMKPQPEPDPDLQGWQIYRGKYYPPNTLVDGSLYKLGETVYVKEAHYRYGQWVKNGLTPTGKQRWRFKAFTNTIYYADNPPSGVKPNSYREEAWYKRSPLFMPEWAVRHFLTMTAVRPERLQEISFRECEAEGIWIYDDPWKAKGLSVPQCRGRFARLWNIINPKYPWESNPWVFAYTFRRAE